MNADNIWYRETLQHWKYTFLMHLCTLQQTSLSSQETFKAFSWLTRQFSRQLSWCLDNFLLQARLQNGRHNWHEKSLQSSFKAFHVLIIANSPLKACWFSFDTREWTVSDLLPCKSLQAKAPFHGRLFSHQTSQWCGSPDWYGGLSALPLYFV